MSLLSLSGVSKRYGAVRALDGGQSGRWRRAR